MFNRLASGSRSGRLVVPARRYSLSFRQYSSTIHNNDPEVLETEKKRNLTGTQHQTSTTHDHAPGWNEYLATSSEAHVKADKSSGDTIKSVQSKTVEHIKKRHHVGETSVEASDQRDDIRGPLSRAQQPDSSDTIKGPLSSSGKDIHHGNTSSEDAVKADRGEH